MTKLKTVIVVSLALATLAWAVVPVEAQMQTCSGGGIPRPPYCAPATGPLGFHQGIAGTPNVDYSLDNFAYSPNIRKFVDALPGLGPLGLGPNNQNTLGQYIPVASGGFMLGGSNSLYKEADYYSIGMAQYSRKLHSDLPPTTLRGYYQIGDAATDPAMGGKPQYLGPLILARSFDPSQPYKTGGNGAPVRIYFENHLPAGASGKLFLPVDTTLMGAGGGPVLCATCPDGWFPYTDNRANIHLHGGNTPWISDGTPHQWIVPANETTIPPGTAYDPYRKGASFQNVPDMIGAGKSIATPSAGDGKGTLYWTNQQSQRLMFFHDHAYGITRLNVYAGMAAGYLLTDKYEDSMIGSTIPDQADLGALYKYGIPLIIQDKTFVNDASVTAPIPPLGACRDDAGNPVACVPTSPTLSTDPLWGQYVGTTGGNLWFAHEYMPNENIFDASGMLAWGRWDYGPWLNPPTTPIYNNLPSPSHVPESYADTMLVNGTPFPYVNLQPKAYRFRILSIGNDRVLNLQWYVAASKNYPTTPGTTGTLLCNSKTPDLATGQLPPKTDCTEVKMVPATKYPTPGFCAENAGPDPNTGLPPGCTPLTWPIDGRNGGVPDPITAGPQIIQIGNEGGILPNVVTIPSQPVDFEYSRRVPVILNVKSQALLLMPAERADVIVDFSAFPGTTLILYNDAPAPMPLFDERNDLYTGNPDWRAIGGAPSVPAGYGPNTRTVMQVNICDPLATSGPYYVPNCTSDPSSFATSRLTALQSALPQAYGASQPPPVVRQTAYARAFPGKGYNTDTYVQNVDSTVNPMGVGQGVSSVKVVLPGSGYLMPPTVSFVPMDGNGSGASATACLNGVTGVTVTLAGAGYTTAPAISFTSPVGVTPTVAASAVASLVGGGVSAIAVTNPGCGYATGGTTVNPPVPWVPANPTITVAAPPCTINTTTCVQATATANVTGGGVSTVTVVCNPNTNPCQSGSSYLKAPFVFFNSAMGDPGRGATADAMLAGDMVIGMKNITEGFEPWYGRMNVQLGTTAVPLDPFTPAPQVPGIAQYIDPPSDYWNDGQPQVFRVAHLGVDSHIIHFHLANLQVVNRVDFTNTMNPPLPAELGWKESIRTNPFTDLVLAVRPVSQWLPFQIPQSNRLMDVTQPAGSTMNYFQAAPVAGLPNAAGISNLMTNYGWEYVWHCHLLGHEENDMMRPIVFTVLPPTNIPTNLRATVNAGVVNLTWTDADAKVRSYRIQRSGPNTSTFPTNVASCNTTSCVTFFESGTPPPTLQTDNTITSPGTYYYRVRAEDGAGVTTWSGTVSARIVVATPPTGLAATLAGTPTAPAINLAWTNGSNAASITVQRDNLDLRTGLAANTRNYTDPTSGQLQPGMSMSNTYSYDVCTVNPAAVGSPACSGPISISVVAPAAPSNVAVTAVRANGNRDTLTVTWTDNSNNESGFTIQYANNPGFTGATTATVGANVTTYSTNVGRGTTVYVQVRANNMVGSSGYVTGTPFPIITPP